MTKQEFNRVDLRPRPKSKQEVERGLKAIKKRQAEFRKSKPKNVVLY